jgi:Ca2+-binding RTX toxin-like protein
MAIIAGTPTNGDDKLFGTTGDDTIDGGYGNDLISGDAGNDSLFGGFGNDTLTGGAGNDFLIGGLSSQGGGNTEVVIGDEIDNGTDTVRESGDFNFFLTNDRLIGNNVDNKSPGSGTDTLSEIERAELTGGASANLIDASAFTLGSVILSGQAGNDTLKGGTRNDTLIGGDGFDTLIGGDGSDTYIVTDANDTVIENTNAGVDIVQSAGSFTLGANLENLTLTASGIGTGNELNNNIIGSNGNDTLDAGVDGNDTLSGGLGNDTYIVTGFTDTVIENANAGVDLVIVQSGASGSFTLGANLENLTLTGSGTGTGNELNNNIIGSNGNDTLDGVTGADTLSGGLGNDTYMVTGTGDTVIENSGAGVDLVKSSTSFILGANLENLTLTGSGGTGTGNELDNNIIGSNGNNTLDAGVSGFDTLSGGLGNDTYIVTGTSDTVIENANAGVDLVKSATSFTLGANLENLTLTGSGTATGNSLNNTINGSNGNDSLTGGAGNDTLNGGLGVDTVIESGSGFTLINNKLTGNGTDTLSSIEKAILTGGNNNDYLDARDFTLGSVTLNGGSGNDFVIGSTGSDSLLGSNGDDVLSGNAGNDFIDGGAGNDFLIEDVSGISTLTNGSLTGNGTDTLSGIDEVSLHGSSGNDILDASGFSNGSVFLDGGLFGQDTLIGGTRNDFIYGGDDANFLYGQAGNDYLSGDRGNDFLYGESGKDTLVGGFGGTISNGELEYDYLYGGTEADLFVLGDGYAPYYLGSGFATIADLSIAEGDKIQLFGDISLYDFFLTDQNSNGVKDTTIEMPSGEVIGIVQDVNVIGANVFTFAPVSPIP